MASMTARIRFENNESGGPAPQVPIPAIPVHGEAELVMRGEALAEARKMADGIAGILGLLRDLDGIIPDEPDSVRLDEIAALFTDIGDFAAYGARAVRRASDAIRAGRQLESA
jgi:hypothetical protein